MAKAWLAAAGVTAGIAGIAWHWRAGVWLAVALLGLAFLLRFAERGVGAP